MSVPVKWPTQPSGSVKKRIATKLGSGPMSNQCVVLSGTRDQVALLAFDLVDLAADVQGEQARAGDEEAHFVFLVEVLVEELLAHRPRAAGCPGAMLTTSTVLKPRSATRRSMSAR